MVHGIGIDIVDIGRIKKLIDRYGDTFLRKVFTASEIRYCGSKAKPWIHFSGRWAAKEAFYKALPGTVQPHSTWKSIEVVKCSTSGQPVVSVCSDILKKSLEEYDIFSIKLSISHEQAICTAIVLLQ